MVHAVCRQCVHRCKQEETITLMRCARFRKRVKDVEFAAMVERMDDIASSADEIRRRTRELLDEARSSCDIPVSPDTGDTGPGDFEDETDQT